ncbi:MAG: catalase family peroxidase [Gluconacetobacter diazotrophicus]|nr:catalase family peroxidase [Gluconacetobacter diazotrophicus]
MPPPPLKSVLAIAVVVGGTAAAFAYTAGWLSPDRISGNRFANLFQSQAVAGHRLNHAKGTCFTGTFRATGDGTALSTAPMLASGEYPVVGRFNLGTPNPFDKDSKPRVRGIGIRIAVPGGQEWRMAMIDPPVFPVSTPAAFYQLLIAGGSKAPNAMADFAKAHPEIAPFGAWAKDGQRTPSYAEERYNSLDSFLFTAADGRTRAVRWSIVPEAEVQEIPVEQFEQSGPDVLEREIADRVAKGPAKWTMTVQVAEAGDPTADPSKAWPAERQVVTVGEMTVDRIIPEPDGPCRDLNFDPTVLPSGMSTSDDPFPSARSAVYAKSYDRRTANAGNYPRDANPYPPAAKTGGAS